VAIVDPADRVLGIFTDGDLRRHLGQSTDLNTTPLSALMTAQPRTITADRLAVDAVQMMEKHRITQLLVVGPDGSLAGALSMHDLLQAKVV